MASTKTSKKQSVPNKSAKTAKHSKPQKATKPSKSAPKQLGKGAAKMIKNLIFGKDKAKSDKNKTQANQKQVKPEPKKSESKGAQAVKASKSDSKTLSMNLTTAGTSPKGSPKVGSAAKKTDGLKEVTVDHGPKLVPVAPALTKKARAPRSSTSRKSSDPDMLYDPSICREIACEGLSTTDGYCRLHYIKNWKKIQRKRVVLKEGKLSIFIEELFSKYPDKFLDAIRGDLLSDKAFAKVVRDLDLDESIDDFEAENSDDDDDNDNVVENVRPAFDDDDSGF